MTKKSHRSRTTRAAGQQRIRILRWLLLLALVAVAVFAFIGGCDSDLLPWKTPAAEQPGGDEGAGNGEGADNGAGGGDPADDPANGSADGSDPSDGSTTGPGSDREPVVRAGYEEILAAVQGLSTERVGFGPGNAVDERNRPLSAISYETKYGSYGLTALTDDPGVIYLTFDQGYENGYTAPILDTLREKGVTATFFLTLSYAERNPDLVRRMIDEGHVLGNHSAAHPSLPSLGVQEAIDDTMKMHDYIADNYGIEMRLYRPPSGEFSPASLKIVSMLGYENVFWSFAYVDWKTDEQPDPADAYRRITEKTHEGAIYLLHSVSATNAAVLGDVIDYWQGQGCEVRAYR